jgi:MYND finger/Sel1 repeat
MRQNRYKAIDWYTLAADQGNATALFNLAQLWELGFPEVGKPASKSKAHENLLRAAQHGSPVAQYEMAVAALESGHDNDDAAKWTWCSLSAAQGFHAAQCLLGEMHMNGGAEHGQSLSPTRSSKTITAMHWYRQAARQGNANAQMYLAIAMIVSKVEICDGLADLPGHSAVPEACFWFGLYEETMHAAHQVPTKRPSGLQISSCACCGKQSAAVDAAAVVKIQRCAKCKGAGYCGKECQVQHWKLGHKLDCANVAKLKDAMKNVDCFVSEA